MPRSFKTDSMQVTVVLNLVVNGRMSFKKSARKEKELILFEGPKIQLFSGEQNTGHLNNGTIPIAEFL